MTTAEAGHTSAPLEKGLRLGSVVLKLVQRSSIPLLIVPVHEG